MGRDGLSTRLTPATTAIQGAADVAHSKTVRFTAGLRAAAPASWSAVRQHRFPVGPLPETMVTGRLTRVEVPTRMSVPPSTSDGKRGVGNHAAHRPGVGEMEGFAVGFDVRRHGEQSRVTHIS